MNFNKIRKDPFHVTCGVLSSSSPSSSILLQTVAVVDDELRSGWKLGLGLPTPHSPTRSVQVCIFNQANTIHLVLMTSSEYRAEEASRSQTTTDQHRESLSTPQMPLYPQNA